MKYALCIGFLLAVLVVGGCATTTAPMSGQIVSAGPVSGPCPYCGQGVTVPATGAVLCPHCGATVRLAQPAPMAAPARTMPSIVLPQVVTVVTGGRDYRTSSRGCYGYGGGYYGRNYPPRPVGYPIPIYHRGGPWHPGMVGYPIPTYRSGASNCWPRWHAPKGARASLARLFSF